MYYWGGVNPARAVLLIGTNLPQTGESNGATISSPSVIRALAFTLPAGNNYRLDDAILRLSNYTSTSTTPLLQIRDDVGGSNPGNTVLASFTTPSPQGSGVFDYTFTPTSSFTFNAGTKYWLYLTTANTGTGFTLRFVSTASAVLLGIPGITPLTGNRYTTAGPAGFSTLANVISFAINATEVTPPPAATPEPGTLAALSLFGLGLLGVKGRRGEG